MAKRSKCSKKYQNASKRKNNVELHGPLSLLFWRPIVRALADRL